VATSIARDETLSGSVTIDTERFPRDAAGRYGSTGPAPGARLEIDTHVSGGSISVV
jgi:hypothetical protein